MPKTQYKTHSVYSYECLSLNHSTIAHFPNKNSLQKFLVNAIMKLLKLSEWGSVQAYKMTSKRQWLPWCVADAKESIDGFEMDRKVRVLDTALSVIDCILMKRDIFGQSQACWASRSHTLHWWMLACENLPRYSQSSLLKETLKPLCEWIPSLITSYLTPVVSRGPL